MDRKGVRHSEVQVKHVTGNQPNRAHKACTKGALPFQSGEGGTTYRMSCPIYLKNTQSLEIFKTGSKLSVPLV